ncbi:hypothetical protein Csa_007972 [Cucumis sativus]|uniref:Uncharacterized protein n=1 Tax=Cucumis sativus TaxID=3659 RepID=A0A0A0KUK3_CUCSA|nr:hypothetical protein Csa_007972 [Cucumis sativus]
MYSSEGRREIELNSEFVELRIRIDLSLLPQKRKRKRKKKREKNLNRTASTHQSTAPPGSSFDLTRSSSLLCLIFSQFRLRQISPAPDFLFLPLPFSFTIQAFQFLLTVISTWYAVYSCKSSLQLVSGHFAT